METKEVIAPPEPEPEVIIEDVPLVTQSVATMEAPSKVGGKSSRPLVPVLLVVVILVAAVLGWYFMIYNKDTDGDGHPDRLDEFPNKASEWQDADKDGWGNNEDAFPDDDTEWLDADNDGYGDNTDIFPNDPLDWMDTDGDGHGDNTDAFPNNVAEWDDTDEDGVGDNQDEFPMDPTEWVDSDGDGTGDNADAFPNDPTEWADTDKDGRGDNSDLFPNDADEWEDNDKDGTGDNADPDDDNDGVLDTHDLFPKANAIIVFAVSEFILKDPIDYSSFGQIWIEINCDGQSTVYLPEPGYYHECEINVPWEIYEVFEFDVPDDKAEWSISITAMDEDDFFDDYVDLSPASTKVLYITYNIQTKEISGDVTSGTADGSDDGTGGTDDDDGAISFHISLKFD